MSDTSFRELVRINKRLSDAECVEVLEQQTRGVLSVLGENGYPYGMPMNHYYEREDGCIYFHCGNVGHRLDALRACGKVSFCVYEPGRARDGDWALMVRSVIVFGQIEILDDMDRITDITTKLSHKFTQDDAYIQTEIRQHGHRTLLLRLKPEHIRGKLVKES